MTEENISCKVISFLFISNLFIKGLFCNINKLDEYKGDEYISYICEKSRIEKSRNMNNPFKFGTIVDGEYFTDRVAEQEKVREILASENHLILISPRRFGKTSLVQKVTKGLSRPVFQLNLQLVTGTADFAARLLWIMLQQYPMERLEYLITHFHFIPTISTNP